MINPALYVAKTEKKGRGVYTSAIIEANIIIETAPVIVMNDTDRQLIDQTLLHDYIFEWQPDGQNLCCMALGIVPIYNHSTQANCEYFMDYETQTIFIKTVRSIPQNEELTINYNGDWDEKAKVWFDVAE